MGFRGVAVGLFALLATAQVVRTAAVAAFADDRPDLAADLWPAHPNVVRSAAMVEIGQAAGRGERPPAATLQRFEALAEAAPLAPEPYLVHGALAQQAGDYARAERLLLQARQRDPRSAAARYLLAELYLRTGRVLPGLAEMSVLGRLVRRGSIELAPALAEFARSEGAISQLRQILADYPELEPRLLAELAEDPRNAELILALATDGNRSPDRRPAWQPRLIGNLVEEGDYAQAHAIWRRLSGVQQDPAAGLFNPRFEQTDAPPPFNWTLASASGGVAEPADGELRVLYFGRDDIVLASQLLLLPAGRYRLGMTVAGELGDSRQIRWTLTCVANRRQLLDLPLGGGAEGNTAAGEFTVPAEGCAAQRLELKGRGQEFPQSADVRIGGLELARIGGR